MTRFWVFAVLAVLPWTLPVVHAGGKQEKDIKIDGKLTKDDPKDAQRGGPMQTHSVQMKAGKTYTIDMVTNEFDAYLRLLDNAGKQLDEDDDSGGNLNSRIIFNCTRDAEYKVVCTTYAADMQGKYTMTVKTTSGPAIQATPHIAMVGKAAPDLHGSFAHNGKPVALTDLKGKVVLVQFWDMRSSACALTFPLVSDWHKTHQGAGLEIVAVTFYPSDFGQRLGFDKDEGKLVTVEQADRKSDQATLQAFAAHHKLPYRLMVMGKEEALKTFEAYSVNGVPQFVVIDRKGMVRFVQVGDKSATAVGEEIKKLLTEK